MTVSDTTSFVSQNGNGSTTLVPYNHPFIAASDLVVNLVTIATGAAVLQVIGTNYTVSGTAPYPSGANITMNVAPPTGTRVTVDRVRPYTQTLDLVENDPLPADPLELDLDHLVMLAQQLFGRTRRSLLLAATSLQIDPTLDDLIANCVLVVNAGATGVTNGPTVTDVSNAAANATAAHADRLLADADVVLTHADVVLTHADVVTTGNNVTTTNTNVTTTNNNVTTTNTNVTNTNSATGALAPVYTYSTTTTMADPGTGLLRFNSVTLASITQVAISALTADSGNPNIRTTIQTWDDSTTVANRGYLNFRKKGTPGTYLTLMINAALTDNTTWAQIPVTFIGSNGTFTNADLEYVGFSRTGDLGATGGGGDTSSNTAVSVDSEIALFNGTTGKSIKRATGTGYAKVASGVLQTPVATIPLTDLATQAATTILANLTGSAAAPTASTLSQILDLIGSAAQGDILYRGASVWARLAASTAGLVLTTQGGGANPSWAAGGTGSGSLATNGYWLFPGGLMIQWGAVTGPTTTFPTSFSSQCAAVVASLFPSVGSGDTTYISCQTKSTSGCTWAAPGAGTVRLIIAIGF